PGGGRITVTCGVAPQGLRSRPSAMMQTNQITPVMMVRRSRFRSTTEDPPSDDENPPPNMSDNPPPLPLWSSTSSTKSRLDRMRAMEIPIVTFNLFLVSADPCPGASLVRRHRRDDSNLLYEGTTYCQVVPSERSS